MPLHTQLMNLKESTFPDEVLNRIYLESCIYFHYIFPHSNTSPFADHRVFAHLTVPHAHDLVWMVVPVPGLAVVCSLCPGHHITTSHLCHRPRICVSCLPNAPASASVSSLHTALQMDLYHLF